MKSSSKILALTVLNGAVLTINAALYIAHDSLISLIAGVVIALVMVWQLGMYRRTLRLEAA